METSGQAVIFKKKYIEECNLFPSIFLYFACFPSDSPVREIVKAWRQ
jgi:hypothetical protein